MHEYTVGVVGAGWLATDYHIPAYRDHDATRVVAVASLEDARSRRRPAMTSGDVVVGGRPRVRGDARTGLAQAR